MYYDKQGGTLSASMEIRTLAGAVQEGLEIKLNFKSEVYYYYYYFLLLLYNMKYIYHLNLLCRYIVLNVKIKLMQKIGPQL